MSPSTTIFGHEKSLRLFEKSLGFFQTGEGSSRIHEGFFRRPKNRTKFLYDPNQNLIQVTKPQGNIVEYDERDLLIAVRVGRNLPSPSRRGAGGEGGSEPGAVTVTAFDANGNPLQVIGPADRGGIVASVTIEDAFRSGLTLTQTGDLALNRYDALNRRIRKTVSGAPTDYLYSGWRCVEDRNSDNTAIAQYVWGIYLDELLQMQTYAPTGSQSLAAGIYYPLADLLYRTTALTDSSGAIVEAYDTDAYGNTLIFSGAGSSGSWWDPDAVQTSSPACPFIFTGQRFDAETGLYYYKRRYYSPELGRFIGRDPIGYRGGMNAYEYVGDNPSGYTDPEGNAILYPEIIDPGNPYGVPYGWP